MSWEERNSIDAKRFPAPLIIGLLLMTAGLIITIYGIFSIVASLTGDIHAFGFIGGLLITPIGLLMMAVGGALMFFGSVRIYRRKEGRILY